MRNRNQEIVTILPNKLKIQSLPWCRDARLVYINGCGALKWEQLGDVPDSYWGSLYLSRLTLNGTPLLSRKAPGCPTCESLLATGWGLAEADAPELEAVRETLNNGFAHLEDTIPALAPLLGLLVPGLYVIADGDTYPSDGGGHFFWDVPDELTVVPATAGVQLMDDDYEYEYPGGAPVFLYPSQRRSRFNPARATYYGERLRQNGPPPRAIALHCAEGVSILLDGHHKAAAAARLGRALPCLTILPAAVSYQPSQLPGRPPKPLLAFFDQITVQMSDIPSKYRPAYAPYRPKQLETEPPLTGCLADREWPEAYKAAGARYPTAKEYALVTAAEIGYPTDEELAEWTRLHRKKRRELRAALVLLRSAGDPRLKAVALQCAAVPDLWCSLKEEAFRILAAMKGDPDVEQFFVDFFIDLEPLSRDRSTKAEVLAEIADRFWE